MRPRSESVTGIGESARREPVVVDARNLRKSFGGRVVLDDVSISVRAGEVFALLGANGAGKTTTIGILTTLLRADSGTARIGGHDVVRERRTVTEIIALTGQSAAVDDVLTGRENLTMLARLRGLGRADAARRADELLLRFDLTGAARRRVGTYSGGMRRRLDLSLSFVSTPTVVFLDEPTTGLDARSRRELWDVIRSLTGVGVTVVLTTQYLEEADQLADRVAVLDHGRIVAEGTPAELKARVGSATVLLHGADGSLVAESPTDGTAREIRATLARWQGEGWDGHVTLRRPTLDDVFLELTAPNAKELS